MLRSVPTSVWSRALLLLALPGCLVSFNDYPLGDPQGAPTSGGKNSVGGASGAAGASGRGGATSGGSSASTAGASTGGSSKAGDTNDAGSPEPGTAGTANLVANALMVDDFEDDNPNILELQGRSGAWYAANDGKGTQTPPAGVPLMPSPLGPQRETSTRGAHTFGGPFATWGALVGTAFASSGNTTIAYDLSGYKGLRLWVRAGTMFPNAAKLVRFSLRTPATITGGGCTVCSDHFGADIPLTSQWQQVELPLATLKQNGYGRPVLPSPDLKHAMGIELLFPANATFDLWIDDVELY